LRLDTAFHSPAAKSCLAASPRGRVNAPGLYLRHHSRISIGSFGFLLPASPAFYFRRGAIIVGRPLPTYDPRTFRLPSNRHSPPGPLDPSGSPRSARVHPEKLAIASCPICLCSPSRCNNELLRCGESTLRLRYFPLGSLSFKPLGVPSDPLDRSLPDRHARPEPGIRDGVT